MTRRNCAVTLAALLGYRLLPAGQSTDTVSRPRPAEQTPPPEPATSAEPKTAIRVNVELVNVLFSVRGKNG